MEKSRFIDWVNYHLDKFADRAVRQEEKQNSLMLMQRDKDFYDRIAKIVQSIGFICLLIFYSLTILPFCIIMSVILGLPCALMMCLKEKYYWMMIKVKGKYPYISSFKEKNI